MRDHTTLDELFNTIQLSGLFPDSKTFCDAIPKVSLEELQVAFTTMSKQSNFNTAEFVATYFTLPEKAGAVEPSDQASSVEEHIERLWKNLYRDPSPENTGTLLALPNSYIVPGGRFGEIYYWDSYFTMLGLKVSNRVSMIEDMVKNFAHFISTYGFIPNGNRSYYLTRSQPPFFGLMVQLLASIKGSSVYHEYRNVLEKEYEFWMEKGSAIEIEPTKQLNRYWDSATTPRPEAYKEDMHLANSSHQPKGELYRHIRAAAASGWDFSTRWFENGNDFSSITTTNIIPVDLNVLLYQLEHILSDAFAQTDDLDKAVFYAGAAEIRKELIEKYCWNESLQTYTDYNFKEGKSTEIISAAMLFPLFAELCDVDRARSVLKTAKEQLLKDGGLLTTTLNSGQQWDAPNGWAPLQWVGFLAALHYNDTKLAKEIGTRWVAINRQVFARTGKMMEKYNVVDVSLEAGGGEYEGQDGFGWTNGVFLALNEKLATLK
ncbi:MAG: hypothetical protein K2P88_07450 [Chitinophagaceae bacterium]|nr:hypothetical protein [Chitinophagaceae bacterium]